MCEEHVPDQEERKNKPYENGEFYADLFHMLVILAIGFMVYYFKNFDTLSK